MSLWTQSILVAARGIYQAAGFRRVKKSRTTALEPISSARLGAEAVKDRSEMNV